MEKNTLMEQTNRTFTEAELKTAIEAVTAQYKAELDKYRNAYAFKRLEFLFKVLQHSEEFSNKFVSDVIYEIEESLTIIDEENND